MPRIGAGIGAVLLMIGLWAALTVDVVKAGYGVKSDEATYVSMALSLAFDHDLKYERRDLDRFFALYRQGPEGIFLKRGKQVHVRLRKAAPFVHVSRGPDSRTDRLYFSKALIYPAAVAPFVRLLGMKGFLVFHVLLLFTVCLCGYLFLRTRSQPAAALMFTLAFVGATVVPVYAVFLMPEIFNFWLVFVAYFLWLYKEVAPEEAWPPIRAFGTDAIAAILLGLATYSKPPNVFLVAPIVVLWWWRGRIRSALAIAAVFGITTAALFGINGLITGEFNYQGGDRKTFYGAFPYDAPDGTWEARGASNTTNESDVQNVLAPSEFVNRFGHNVEYFLIGRHFGFVPYFFPGALAILMWLVSPERYNRWRLLTFATLALSTIGLLMFLPYTWSGGGGPPGNRYFLNFYPLTFFLTPPLQSAARALLAWFVGAMFTAKMIVSPFVTAKFTWQATERGMARRLPVELPMANDLPVMLDRSRGYIPYNATPTVILYFLDENAFAPEPEGMWVSANGRADIILRSDNPLDHLAMTARSPIRTTLTVSVGGSNVDVPIVPGKPATFDVPTYGVRGLNSYAYLFSAQCSNGFVPHLVDPKSADTRNLGAQVTFRAIERH